MLSIALLTVCSWTLAGIYHRPQNYDDWNAIERTQGQSPDQKIQGTNSIKNVGVGAVPSDAGIPPALTPPASSGNAPVAPGEGLPRPWLNGRRRRPNQNHETPEPQPEIERGSVEDKTPAEFFGRSKLHEKSKVLDRYAETSSLTPTERPRVLPTFINMEGDYKWLATGCLGGSMLAGLIQCVSSLFAMCSYSKDISQRMRLWVILQCIVFLILVITILVPLTYDPVKQQHLKLDEILPHTRSRMLYSIFDAGKNVHEILLHDFNAYFIVTILNEAFLLLFTISVCCLVKCGQQSYQPIRN